MIKIGVVGSSESKIIKDIIITLINITDMSIKEVKEEDYSNDENYNVDIIIIFLDIDNTKIEEKFNILLLNAEKDYRHQNKLIQKLETEDFLIVDADDSNLFNDIIFGNGTVITCGFNHKACVTTSSIVDNQQKIIQICIQRSFKTINNKMVNQQEFSVNLTNNDGKVYNILSAVTAVLMCGINIED